MHLILHTERLILRPLQLDDLDLALEMFTDPDVTRFVGGLMSPEEIESEMPLYVRRCGGGCIGIWCALDRASDEKLGTCVLIPLPIDKDDTDWDLIDGPDIPDGDIEVGYILRKSAWGKGYATEITKRLLRFAFEDTPLQEVVATFDDENINSRNVLLKAGLRDMGKRHAYAEENCPDFRITREQWLEDQTH